MTWRESLGPLREANFAWFFASRLVNLLGTTMASVALAFAVLEVTGSGSDLGKVLAAHSIPMVIFLLAGGVIADRVPRTLLLQVSNLTSALSQGALAVLFITDQASLGAMMALSAVHGMVSAVSFPAMAAMTPQLVDRGSLQQANALLSMARGSLTVLGPSAGALLVVTVGPGWALAVDALTWALAALLLLPVRLPRRTAPTTSPAGAGSGMLGELREGWQLFRSTTWLWAVVLGFSLLNAIHAGAWFTLGPARAQDTIGAQGWGLVLSAESVGLLLMTAVLLRISLQRPLLWGMCGVAVMAAPITLLGAAPHLVLLIVVAVLAGAGMEVFSLGWNLAMQENVDESQLSRAYSYDALGSFVAMPIGQLAFGPLGERFGYQPVLVLSGVAWLVICAVTLLSRSVRTLPRSALPAPGSVDTPTGTDPAQPSPR